MSLLLSGIFVGDGVFVGLGSPLAFGVTEGDTLGFDDGLGVTVVFGADDDLGFVVEDGLGEDVDFESDFLEFFFLFLDVDVPSAESIVMLDASYPKFSRTRVFVASRSHIQYDAP